MEAQAAVAAKPLVSEVDASWELRASSPRVRSEATHAEPHSRRGDARKRARSLGYFSLALGLVQLTLTERFARLIGIRSTPRTRAALRAIGAREIASGIGLLARDDAATFAWSRLAGDAMDLALLGAALSDSPKNRVKVVAAMTAVVGTAALDVYSASRLSRSEAVQKLTLPIHVVRSITINRPPEAVYQVWRDLESLPRFMAHLESVSMGADGISRWRAKAPAGLSIEWEAEVTLDRENDTLAWRSLEGASVPNRGVVRFKPGPAQRGTELRVELKYEPPAGTLGAAVAKLFGEEPGQQIQADLRRFKQMLETGGVVHSDASIHSGLHAARPPSAAENITVLGRDAV